MAHSGLDHLKDLTSLRRVALWEAAGGRTEGSEGGREKENTLGGLRTQHASLLQELVTLHLESKCEAGEEREKMGVWHAPFLFFIRFYIHIIA